MDAGTILLVFCLAESSHFIKPFLVYVLINSFEEPSEIGGAHTQAIFEAKAGASIRAAFFEHFFQHRPVKIRVRHNAIGMLTLLPALGSLQSRLSLATERSAPRPPA